MWAEDSDPRAPLIGRDDEFALARVALDELASGIGQALVLEGEAGVGKSRLLKELLDEARERGLTVLSGAAHELERSLPFAALVDALDLGPGSSDIDRAAIGRLIAGDDGGNDGEFLHLRVVRGIVDLVDRLSQSAPVVLALEDVHWADPSTLLVASRLVRRLSLVPLCLVLTSRPYPKPPELASLLQSLDAAGGRHVVLEPLSGAEVSALVRRLLDAEPGPSLARLVAGAGGNPLFVIELVSALHEEGSLRVTSGTADVPATDVPPSLRITILRRLSALPQATVDLLRLAAILGTTFDSNDLALLAARPSVEVTLALEPAVAAGIIAGAGDRIAFRHGLIADAVYDDLAEPLRRGLHAQVARTLTAAGRSASHVAPHLIRAAAPGDNDVRDGLRQAASEVGPAAHQLAADLLRKAVEIDEADGREDDDLVVDFAQSLLASRKSQEAENLARRLLARKLPSRLEHQSRLILADALLFRYRAGDAVEQLEQAFKDAGLSDGERAQLAMRIAILWQLRGDLDRSESWAHQARALGALSDEPTAAVGALLTLAASRRYRGFVDEGEAFARMAEECKPDVQHLYSDVGFFWASHWAFSDRPEKGIAVLREALRRDDRRGRPLAVHHNLLARVHTLCGEWDDAVTEWEVLAGTQEEESSGGGAFAAGVLALIALQRHTVAAAQAWAAKAKELATGDDMSSLTAAVLAHVDGLMADASGDAARSLSMLTDAGRRLREIDYMLFEPGVPVDAARVAHAHGAAPLAEQAAADATLLAERSNLAHARAAALQCRGLAAGDPDLVLESVTVWRDETSWLPATATALIDAARLLAGAARQSEAIALTRDSLAIWERVGAVREVARAEKLLRSLGVRPGRLGERRRPTIGWGSLTKSEVKVIELVAEGLTYREVADHLFVSRRTVETHVAHAFIKLGVSSRRDLARAWERRAPGVHPTDH